MVLDNTPSLSHVWVGNSKLRSDIYSAVMNADVDMTTDQVSQLTFELVDQGFTILKSGVFNIGNSVRYSDMRFVVSGIDVDSESGQEKITIKCRPKVVSDLKKRQGTKVL